MKIQGGLLKTHTHPHRNTLIHTQTHTHTHTYKHTDTHANTHIHTLKAIGYMNTITLSDRCLADLGPYLKYEFSYLSGFFI